MMDASVEAYKVNIEYVGGKINTGGNGYKPTYYYIVDDVEYQYTPIITSSHSKTQMMNKTLYYNQQSS